MLLKIVVAPHTKDGVGVRHVQDDLKQILHTIESAGQEQQVEDMEFHRKLADLNRRRLERRAG